MDTSVTYREHLNFVMKINIHLVCLWESSYSLDTTFKDFL